MKGHLKLWIETDGDGTGELFAQFNANGFSGVGSAWFDLVNLAERAKLFEQYPLPKEGSAKLEGGYWSAGKPAVLDQEHLHISAYPTNSRGEIGIRIRVATPLGKDERQQSQFLAAVELKTNYEDLARFSRQLGLLARGEAREVVLDTNEV